MIGVHVAAVYDVDDFWPPIRDGGVDCFDDITDRDGVQPRVRKPEFARIGDGVGRRHISCLLAPFCDHLGRPFRLVRRGDHEPEQFIAIGSMAQQRPATSQRLVIGVGRDCQHSHRVSPFRSGSLTSG
jgi:hypothetical protein